MRIDQRIFNLFHGNKLVYNACWEDPVCDKKIMAFDEDSEIVMITSAGCNALSYLLEDPKHISCIDLNYRQNALLELKKACFYNGDYDLHQGLFGAGRYPGYKTAYARNLRKWLPDFAQQYWDKKIHYFSGKGLRDTFYYRGTSGVLAYMASRFLRLKKSVRHGISSMFDAHSLEEQARHYKGISQKIYTDVFSWFLNTHVVMSLAGVPKSQQDLFKHEYARGTMGFIEQQFDHVFTKLPAHQNYFYKVYYDGAYTEKCRPEYVEEQHFEYIKERVDRISTHTTSISSFLKKFPKAYSHYVLLDHQDWMAANDKKGLEEEWRLVLSNSKVGTKILLRSAAKTIDFFPDFVGEHVEWDIDKANLSQRLDRVGTYTSTYIGTVIQPLS